MSKMMVVLACLGTFGLAACGADGPETKKARELAAKYDDIREARDIVDGAIAHKVNCALAAQHAFSKATGKAQVWTYRAGENALIECFDTEGYHPTGRSALRTISSFEVAEIQSNPEYYPLPVLPTPAPRRTPSLARTTMVVAAVEPQMALPVVNDGPCCEQ